MDPGSRSPPARGWRRCHLQAGVGVGGWRGGRAASGLMDGSWQPLQPPCWGSGALAPRGRVRLRAKGAPESWNVEGVAERRLGEAGRWEAGAPGFPS